MQVAGMSLLRFSAVSQAGFASQAAALPCWSRHKQEEGCGFTVCLGISEPPLLAEGTGLHPGPC